VAQPRLLQDYKCEDLSSLLSLLCSHVSSINSYQWNQHTICEITIYNMILLLAT